MKPIDLAFASDLISALAAHMEPDETTLTSLLWDPAIENTWLEPLLIDLAGACRIRGAVPALLARRATFGVSLLGAMVTA